MRSGHRPRATTAVAAHESAIAVALAPSRRRDDAVAAVATMCARRAAHEPPRQPTIEAAESILTLALGACPEERT